jgi:hypothetical protein
MKKGFIVYLIVPILLLVGGAMVSYSQEIARFLYANYIDIIFVAAEALVVMVGVLLYNLATRKNEQHVHN